MKKSFILIMTFAIIMGLFYTKLSLTLVGIGIIAAFIGTLAGGAGLITIPAMMLVGIPIQTSIATNKFSSGIAALSSIFYLFYHKELRLASIMKYVAVAIAGGVCGALLTVSISEKTMNIIACILLIFALFITFKNKEWTVSSEENDTKHNNNFWQPFLCSLRWWLWTWLFNLQHTTFFTLSLHLHKGCTAHTRTYIRELYRGIYSILPNWLYSMAICNCDGSRLYYWLSARTFNSTENSDKSS